MCLVGVNDHVEVELVVTSIFFNSSDVGRPNCYGKEFKYREAGATINVYLLLVVELAVSWTSG